MKFSRVLGVLGFAAAAATAQLAPGDIAFTGWNADGVDNIAFVALKDIPANTRIYFCDSEWNGTGFGTDEGDFSWTSSALVPAGTVIALNGLDSAVTSASIGSLAHDNSGGLGNSDEAMFAYLVSSANPDSVRKPSVFLAAATNGGLASLGVLTGTGLTLGSTAIALKAGADIAAYVGPRAGRTAAGYLITLNDSARWISQDASGNQHVDGTAPDLPFNLAAFTFGSITQPVTPAISFDKVHYSVKENAGSVTVRLNASAAPSDTAGVQVRLTAGGTAVAGTDFTFATQTYAWPADSANFRTINIPLINNGTAQPDRFFVLDLVGPSKATLGANTRLLVYILDDDGNAPARSGELDLKFVSSYKVDSTSGASAEIVSYDPKSKRLFAMNSTRDKLEILNFKNPRAVSRISTIDLTAFGAGGTSVATHNGLVAVTIDAANFQPGKVVFLDTNGTVLKNVNVGSLPDMVTFSPDGKLVLTANEGQPSGDYTIDPEGSVSVIDVSGGIAGLSQSNVTTMNFNAFDAQKDALKAQGVRIFGLNNPTVSKDLEPEYITVSEDSKTAWITLQENNAIAKADLVTKTITHIFPLGLKDHSLPRNAFDASDRLDSVFFGNWPVKGVYMPDAIASLKVGDTSYVFTANEGDAREYSAYIEEKKVGDAGYVLDSAAFPNAAILKLPNNLGRLAVTGASGDTDGDGDYDQIHAFGARSFSVWNGVTGAQVWDSGDELERITARDSLYKGLFNASNDNTTFKNRSDNKGPEPEGIAIGKIGSKAYAFVALERTGGVMAYEVTNPKAPRFVTYANNRSPVSSTDDLGSEGIIFIPRAQSPNDTALVVMANEVSATVSVYSVRDTNRVVAVAPQRPADARNAFALRWSADRTALFFSRPVDFRLADARGRVQRSGNDAAWVDLKGMQRGRYFLTVPGAGSFAVMVTK